MKLAASWRKLVFGALGLAALGLAPSARAECGGNPNAEACGASCLAEGQKCCTDILGGGLQWLCPDDGTCGESYQSCSCGGAACLACNDWEFKCPAGQLCLNYECYTACADGTTCPLGHTCFTNGAGKGACCDASANQVCGGSVCISKASVCCAGSGTPYGCSSDHRCGSKQDECVLIASDLAGCAASAPSGTTSRGSALVALALGLLAALGVWRARRPAKDR